MIQNFPILEILNFPECKRKVFKIIPSDGKLNKSCSKGQIATYKMLAKSFPKEVFKIKESKKESDKIKTQIKKTNLRRFNHLNDSGFCNQVRALEAYKAHKGYISVQIKGQFTLALIDSGNSINYDTCIRAQLARDLKLKIQGRKISVGSASSN